MWRESLRSAPGGAGGAAAQRGAAALFERVQQYYALANEEDYRKNGQWHLGRRKWPGEGCELEVAGCGLSCGCLVQFANCKFMRQHAPAKYSIFFSKIGCAMVGRFANWGLVMGNSVWL